MRSARSSQRRKRLRLGLLRLTARGLPQRRQTRTELERVLLLRPDHIGDVLLTAPAVALLRASLPRAHITYVVGPWSAEAARHGPPVDEVRTLAYPGFTRRPNPNLLWPYALAVRTAARLRREQYDLALVFRPDHWWGALLGALAAIPLRVGSQTPETAPLLTHSHATNAPEHAAEQALSLARLALSVAGVAPTPASQVATFSVSAVIVLA